MAVSSVSYTNTPQAGDDVYFYNEDDLFGGQVLALDVMSNDLGGKAKKLFSIDDGNGALSDLLTRDPSLTTAWQEKTAQGNSMRINGGQIEVQISNAFVEHVNSLSVGETATDTFKYAIQLGNGTISYATVTLQIAGENDAVVITSSAQAGTVTEDATATPSTTDSLAANGAVTFTDVDIHDAHAVSYTGTAQHGTFSLGTLTDTSNGVGGSQAWSYALNNSDTDVQALGVGEHLTETFTISVTDNHGSTQTQNVTITIEGTNDQPDITLVSTDSAGDTQNETNAGLTANGTLTVVDPDLSDAVTAAVHDVALSGTTGGLTAGDVQGMLTVTAGSIAANAGDTHNLGWTFDSGTQAFDFLAAGEHLTLTYTVRASDGSSAVDDQSVTITINGTNDPALISGQATGSVTEAGSGNAGGTPTATGDLLATDVDNATDVFQAVTVAAASDQGYGSYTMTSAGVWTYTLDNSNPTVDALHTGGTLTDTFTALSQDGTAQVVTITINGADDVVNHAPTDISLNMTHVPGGNALPGAGTVLGNFSTADPDGDTVFSYSLLGGSSAGFSVNGTTGVLSNTVGLAENTTYTLNVQSQDPGGLTYQETFNIITGTNTTADNPLMNSLNALLSGDDVLYGSGGNDVIFGGSGNDTIFGQNGSDTIYGGAGNDVLNGGNQSDKFVFLAADGGGVDTIKSFSISAPASNGDVLDISDLLIDYHPGVSNINDFVKLVVDGGNTTVQVDRDGAGSTYAAQDVAVLQGLTGLSVSTLLSNGNIDPVV